MALQGHSRLYFFHDDREWLLRTERKQVSLLPSGKATRAS